MSYTAMIPEFWLTEGGQSATGALLEHIIENHSAAPILANRAASQSKLLMLHRSLLLSC
jgi:ribulose kinase